MFAGLALPGAAQAADAPTVGSVMTVKRERTHLVLEASVSPNGAPATVHVEFGDTPSLGGTTSDAAVPAEPPSTLVSITLNKLKPGNTYYFRVVATNSAGTTRSEIG